jgi:aspartate aminotransferase-like enzyme
MPHPVSKGQGKGTGQPTMNRSKQGRGMGKKAIGVLLLSLAFASVHLAQSAAAGKIFRIGYLDNSTASTMAVRLEAFQQELSKLGWIEGKNITIE